MSENGNKGVTLKPSTNVEVQLPDRQVLDKDAIRALEQEGLVPISDMTLRNMETLGIWAKGAGIVRLQVGRTMVKHQRIDAMLRQVVKEIEKLSTGKEKNRLGMIAKLVDSASNLINADTKVQQVALEAARAVAPGGTAVEEGEPEVRAFASNKPVRLPSSGTLVMGNEVHVHQKDG